MYRIERTNLGWDLRDATHVVHTFLQRSDADFYEMQLNAGRLMESELTAALGAPCATQ